jgi:6-pyruvoyltetrahydropterin/6-carboxytetrahydropterin synthase
MSTFQSTKTLAGYPCAHRQWKDKGNCAFIHGYSRSFHLTFQGELDEHGWVKDFGSFGSFKQFLDWNFDHTLLLAPDDPIIHMMQMLEKNGACKLILPPYGPSMEGCARWVLEEFNSCYRTTADQIHNVQLIRVEVRENEKNSGVYEVPYVHRVTNPDIPEGIF